MPVFNKILIDVDLGQDGSLPSTSWQAVRAGQWLARTTSAELTFFSVLVGPALAARTVLADITAKARAEGLKARVQVAKGDPWGEILRQVQGDRHDLVMVGAPQGRGLTRSLFGSTGTKLLNHCPCPVWFAVPGSEPSVRELLIASDLTPRSEKVLDLGIQLAQEVRSNVHILHVVDYQLDRWSNGDLDQLTARYHRLVRTTAARALRQQLQENVGLADPFQVQIHVTGRTPVPDIEILHFLHKHPMDLLVLGTVGRTGLAQILLGNTAEQVLPEVPCSVLVVKPSAQGVGEQNTGHFLSLGGPSDFG